jgi:hypothetical protein
MFTYVEQACVLPRMLFIFHIAHDSLQTSLNPTTGRSSVSGENLVRFGQQESLSTSAEPCIPNYVAITKLSIT